MEVAEGARLGWSRRFKAAPPMLSVYNHEFMDREKSAQRPVTSPAWFDARFVGGGAGEPAHAGVREAEIHIVRSDASAEQGQGRLDRPAHGADKRPVARGGVWLVLKLRLANFDKLLSRNFFHKGLSMLERKCGPCQLCCRLMPILETGKDANVKCAHQRFRTGCAIYGTRPQSCRAWACTWLVAPELAGLRRPDIAGYVIDPSDDFFTIQKDDPAKKEAMRMIQIWCDPKRRDAHRDPALRSYLESQFAKGFVGVVRYGAVEGVALIPPAWSGKGWIEFPTTPEGRTHTTEDYVRIFGGKNAF
jgi:hypothetical protein